MSALSKKWIKWIAVLLGVAGMLTPALLELGWIPENQAMKALIFLMGFMVLDSGTRESKKSGPTPELVTDTANYFHTLGEFVRSAKHEIISIVHGEDILRDEIKEFLRRLFATVRSEKQLHCYVIVVARLSDLSEEGFQRRSALERDPSFEGRYHYRFIDAPVSFGCQVIDQNQWTIDFPPNPEDPRGAAIIFRNDPDGARLVASFIRHQWLERPDITMSLSEAYEKWKAIKNITAVAE